MNAGKAQQIGTPREVYEMPVNQFVAYFVGMANFIKGNITDIHGEDVSVSTEYGAIKSKTKGGFKKGTTVLVSVRPEALTAHKHGIILKDMNLI